METKGTTKSAAAKAEWVKLVERAERLSGKAKREAIATADAAFEAYVHSGGDDES